MRTLFALLLLSSFVSLAKASVVAVIDSGTDLEHKALRQFIWTNPYEDPMAGDTPGEDDDGNEFIDDYYGWNFAENNNQLIDYSYQKLYNDDVKKFFEIQAKQIMATATEEDKAWMKEKREDKEFLKGLSTYANYMHGTHVSGISMKEVKDSELLSVKLIPTEVKLPFSIQSQLGMEIKNKTKLWLLKKGLTFLAEQQMVMLSNVAQYVGNHEAVVANGSFGTGYPQVLMIVEAIYKPVFGEDNPDKEKHLKELATHFLKELIQNGEKEMVAKAPRTLFVFAAGNDGMDNDQYPASPASIRAPNSMTVAATIGRQSLASFSNYGAINVDVAAPGVAIESTAPRDLYLQVSGTSQAAPYVTNVAAKVIEVNEDLDPSEVKRIIMETVDVKDWLFAKVKSGGIVNLERAVFAAKVARLYGVAQGIEQAKRKVADVPVEKSAGQISEPEYVLPMPSLFR